MDGSKDLLHGSFLHIFFVFLGEFSLVATCFVANYLFFNISIKPLFNMSDFLLPACCPLRIIQSNENVYTMLVSHSRRSNHVKRSRFYDEA